MRESIKDWKKRVHLEVDLQLIQNKRLIEIKKDWDLSYKLGEILNHNFEFLSKQKQKQK